MMRLRASSCAPVSCVCVTRIRLTPNPRFPLVVHPVVPHARARRPRRLRRRRRRHTRARRLDDATARAIARHCARLCRARVSLTRTSSRTPASLSSSSAVVPDARARRRRGGGGTARARRLGDATKHAIFRVIARVCDASVGHSRARHPEPRFPLLSPPRRPPRARARGGGGSGGGGDGGTSASASASASASDRPTAMDGGCPSRRASSSAAAAAVAASSVFVSCCGTRGRRR